MYYNENTIVYYNGKYVNATVPELCQALGIAVVERQIRPEEVKGADGAFMCGTAAEVIGVQSWDDGPFAKPWSETPGATLQKAYKNFVLETDYNPTLKIA